MAKKIEDYIGIRTERKLGDRVRKIRYCKFPNCGYFEMDDVDGRFHINGIRQHIARKHFKRKSWKEVKPNSSHD